MTTKKTEGGFLDEAKDLFEERPATLPARFKREVVARQLTAREVRAISHACRIPGKNGAEDTIDNDKFTVAVMAASLFDKASGERLIPEGREAELDDLPSDVWHPLNQAALAVNGMLVDQEAPGKD